MRFSGFVLMAALTIMMTSCASREDIMQNYEERVNYTDGINLKEAKIIAQRKIISVQEKRYYKITAPGVINNDASLKYDDYWFIIFGRNWLSPISTEEGAKTYTELKEAQYLVVIGKKDGQIVFSGEYYPKRSPNFDWVFQERRPWDERVNPPAGIPSEF